MQIFKPCNILIPKEKLHEWSVVACDQFTSAPEYWQKVRKIAGDAPSAVNIILPEAELGLKNQEAETVRINRTMSEYLDSGVFREYPDSLVYVERTLPDGAVRRGLVGAFDLETYDWSEGTLSPIRATEFTVEDRLPPRVKIRRAAPLEMPHIMIFCDDAEDTVLGNVKKGEPVYDFELMLGGGHIRGWLVENEKELAETAEALGDPERLRRLYGDAPNPMVFAMGDGNHSLAAAKRCWEEIKPTLSETERKTHPARYAMAELVNLHDAAIVFEPIHRLVIGVDKEKLTFELEKALAPERGAPRLKLELCCGGAKTLSVSKCAAGRLIGKIDAVVRSYTEQNGGTVDYIHGDDELRVLSEREGNVGILMPSINKSELFSSVMRAGPFPKKSFSIGTGSDKRYYLECRSLR